MLKTPLRQDVHTDATPTQHWLSPGERVQVCAFSCPPHAAPFPPGPPEGRLEILFLREGELQVRRREGTAVALRGGDILLRGACADALRAGTGQLKGLLVTAEGGTFRERVEGLRRLLGTLEMDADRAAAQLEACQGWGVVRGTAWTRGTMAAIEALPEEERPRYCAVKAAELLYLLCREGLPLLEPSAERYYDRYQTQAVAQVRDYLLAHLDQRPTIQQLSRRFHLSPTTLKACFRQTYGQPIHQYVQERRMERAASLLADTDLPVSQIAAMTGYESPSQFGVAFRRRYRLSPTTYRRGEGKNV